MRLVSYVFSFVDWNHLNACFVVILLRAKALASKNMAGPFFYVSLKACTFMSVFNIQ